MNKNEKPKQRISWQVIALVALLTGMLAYDGYQQGTPEKRLTNAMQRIQHVENRFSVHTSNWSPKSEAYLNFDLLPFAENNQSGRNRLLDAISYSETGYFARDMLSDGKVTPVEFYSIMKEIERRHLMVTNNQEYKNSLSSRAISLAKNAQATEFD